MNEEIEQELQDIANNVDPHKWSVNRDTSPSLIMDDEGEGETIRPDALNVPPGTRFMLVRSCEVWTIDEETGEAEHFIQGFQDTRVATPAEENFINKSIEDTRAILSDLQELFATYE